MSNTTELQPNASLAYRTVSMPHRCEFVPGPPTVYDAIDSIQVILDRADGAAAPRTVLEAGCGSSSYFRIRRDDFVVGIDISRKQLARNDQLDEKILGDIEDFPLTPERFDLVVCWYVLEHLRRPDRAMRNMIQSLKPGGMLVIAVPSVSSFKGLVTKFTPHWFHVLVHRCVFGRRDAGREDRPPFPAYMDWTIQMGAIERLAHEKGLEVAKALRFEDYTQRRWRTRSRAARALYRIAAGVADAITLGRWNIYLTDFAIVLRKTQ